MRNYEKDVSKLLDACVRVLAYSEGNPTILIYSKNEPELANLRRALHETVNKGIKISFAELPLLLIEEVLNEEEQDITREFRGNEIVFLSDLHLLSDKNCARKIVYDILRERIANGRKTFIFAEQNLFLSNALDSKFKILLECAEKYMI